MTDFAQLALSLRDNEAFQASLDRIKASATDTLSTISADDKNGILKAQATIAVVNDIRADIEAFLRPPRKQPGIA